MTSAGDPMSAIDDVTPTAFEEANAITGSIKDVNGIDGTYSLRLTQADLLGTGFTVDADGDTALKSLLVDDSSTIGCDSDTDLMSLADGALTVNGTLSADTSFTLDAVSVNATELGFIDGVTAGTAAASKALVLDANKDIGSIRQLTASAIKVDVLDVNTINSVTQTESTLEVLDKKVVTSLSASSALFITFNALNSFYDPKFSKNAKSQIIDLKKLIEGWKSDKNLILVTHYVVISSMLNVGSSSGEIIVVNNCLLYTSPSPRDS